MARTLTDDDVKAIAVAVAWLIDPPQQKWYRARHAAKLLGLSDGRLIATWGNGRDVLIPGKEIRKLGRFWQVNVEAVNKRLEKEQRQPRQITSRRPYHYS